MKGNKVCAPFIQHFDDFLPSCVIGLLLLYAGWLICKVR
jgi:hypothetical protein